MIVELNLKLQTADQSWHHWMLMAAWLKGMKNKITIKQVDGGLIFKDSQEYTGDQSGTIARLEPHDCHKIKTHGVEGYAWSFEKTLHAQGLRAQQSSV